MLLTLAFRLVLYFYNQFTDCCLPSFSLIIVTHLIHVLTIFLSTFYILHHDVIMWPAEDSILQ